MSGDSTSDSCLRSPRDGPWCWQSKTARRIIRDGCDASATVASALAVYAALTEIASDEGRQEFTTTVAHIASYSGLADRCVRARLRDLELLNVVAIETPALKAPSLYRLLGVEFSKAAAVRHCSPSVRHISPDVRQTAPHDRHQKPDVRHSIGAPSVPTVEERGKKDQRTQTPPAGAAADARVVDLCFNALCAAEGSNPSHLTKSECRRIAVALTEIRAATPAVTPAEIAVRAARYSRVMPNGCRLTAMAMAKNWSKLEPHNPRPDVIIPDEPEYWREFLNEEHEGSKYSRDGEHEGTSWRELPDHVRTLCLKGLPGWLERTGRVAASAA
jgi:hypothetical protein